MSIATIRPTFQGIQTAPAAPSGQPAVRRAADVYFSGKKSQTIEVDALLDQVKKTLGKHYIKQKFPFMDKGPDVEAQKLADKLWKRVFEPLMRDPEASRQAVARWQQSLTQREFTNPMYKELAEQTLAYFDRGFALAQQDPEMLKTGIRLLADILENGGYDKLNAFRKLQGSPDYVNADATRRGQLLLEAFGPTFVKAFQAISTVPGLFSPDAQASLKKLYEDVTPLPAEVIAGIIQQEFGKPAFDVDPQTHRPTGKGAYDWFSMQPHKAGSIAQVHQAMIDGQTVAVKIVKPGVRESIDKDFKMLAPCLRLVGQLVPSFQKEAEKFFNTFAEQFANECNMKKLPGEQIDGEADKLKRVGALYQNYDGVRVPRVYDDHTTKNILTMEWMPGDSLLAHQGDKHVAQSYLELLFDQIFIYGACQADPHPGNLLYTEDEDGVGRFSFIDAGLLHNVDELKRADLIKLMIALYVGKSKPMAYALLGPDAENKHGYPQFIKKLDALRNEVFDAGKTPTIDAPGGGTLGSNIPGANKVLEYKDALEFLARAQKLAKDCGFEPIEPDELLLKTLFTAITVAKTLHPEASINFKMVRNVARAVLKDAHSKDYDFLLSTSILAAGDKLGPGAGKAAGKLGELTGKAGDKIGDNKVGRAFDAVGDFIERHADDVNSAADQVGGRLGETLSELAPDKAAEMIDKAKNGALGLLKRRGKKK